MSPLSICTFPLSSQQDNLLLSKKVKELFLSNICSSISVLSFDREDYNNKKEGDEDSIVIDCDGVNFTLENYNR